jgi:hypothetical protein
MTLCSNELTTGKGTKDLTPVTKATNCDIHMEIFIAVELLGFTCPVVIVNGTARHWIHLTAASENTLWV